MGRLTQLEEKAHDDALALLSLTRVLSNDEVDFVYRHYSPLATHRVAQNAIYFTPPEAAALLAIYARMEGRARIIDLAAGIGILTHHMLLAERWDDHTAAKQHVCVELDAEFVAVGRKLLPQVEWVCGNSFDPDLMHALGSFDAGIANPPFGQIPALKAAKTWLRARVPAHLATVEVMLRMCRQGGTILLPRNDQNIQRERRTEPSSVLKRMYTAWPGVQVSMDADLDGLCDDEGKPLRWHGADPDVVVADVNIDDAKFELPYGWSDARRGARTPTLAPTRIPVESPAVMIPAGMPSDTQQLALFATD